MHISFTYNLFIMPKGTSNGLNSKLQEEILTELGRKWVGNVFLSSCFLGFFSIFLLVVPPPTHF